MASEQQQVRKTSLLAYCQEEESKRMGKRQKMVYDCLLKHPNITDSELARYLGFSDPNRVRPRRNDLEKAGIVGESGRRPCRVTGKLCHIWRVKRD